MRKVGNPSHTVLQVLNGAIAAALFNLLYDLVLSQKVKWYAMCPVVDFLNHKSIVQVQHLVPPSPFRRDEASAPHAQPETRAQPAEPHDCHASQASHIKSFSMA